MREFLDTQPDAHIVPSPRRFQLRLAANVRQLFQLCFYENLLRIPNLRELRSFLPHTSRPATNQSLFLSFLPLLLVGCLR